MLTPPSQATTVGILPGWATELVTLYESAAANQFVLYGNVNDRILLPLGAKLELGGLSDFLLRVLMPRFDVVLSYDLGNGVRVEKGAVISMGVFIGASTKIVDRASGDVLQGRVPAGAVVVPGTLPGRPLPDGSPGPNLSCAVIVKRVDAQTRAKTSINDLLRD